MQGLEARARTVLDRRLDPASPAPVALALSGGGDSLALLRIAAPWCAEHGRRLVALTVDHRLHPDSAAWTAFAAEAAQVAGAEWRGLAWEGPKPASGLPAAARAARHRLLAEAARAAGARVLLTGHTLADVAEGELMRQADAPTLGALTEWAPSPAWPEGRGLFLLRPLLEIGRAELRAWLSARGLAWIEDPANTDPRFARARARAALSKSPSASTGEGFGMGTSSPRSPKGAQAPLGSCEPPHPPPLAHRGGREATTLHSTAHHDARFTFERAAFRAPGAARLLSAALLSAAGTDRPPRGERLARLLAQLSGAAPTQATLAGARVEAAGETVQIGRDAGERFRGGLTPLALPAGSAVVWDGRFEIEADEAGWRAEPLGGLIGKLAAEERRDLRDLPAWARGSLPALVDGEGGVRLPRPFGGGPAQARSLAGCRLAAACGLMAREGDIGESRHGAAAPATLC